MGMRITSAMIEWQSRLNGSNGLILLLYLMALWFAVRSNGEYSENKKLNEISFSDFPIPSLLTSFQ